MPSKQQLPPVPQINSPPVSNTPAIVSSSDGDYFTSFESLTSAGSTSPRMPPTFSATPHSLLRTPVEPLSSSQSRPRTNTQGEASIRSAHSSTRITRATSASGHHSNTLSLTVSSGGESYHSSDTGYRTCSHGSNGYLTPPQSQPDTGRRPYKPRRGSEDSLIMVKNKKKRHRRGRRNCSCGHHSKSHPCQDSDGWGLPGCQVAPTASKGMKELCRGHTGTYRPLASVRGTTDTYGRVLPRPWSDPVPPVISRRWSSVEVAAHRIHLASTLATKPIASSRGSRPPIRNRVVTPRRSSRPYRSSTYTRGAIEDDIVRTVREKLTLRKVPSSHLQTPTTITLRRASGASGVSGISTVTQLLMSAKSCDRGCNISEPYLTSQADTKTDAAYLITRKEIDSITELIEANLRRNFRPHNHGSAHLPVNSSGFRSPTFTLKGIVPLTPSTAASSVTVTQATAPCSKIPDSFNYLQVASQSCAIPTGALRGMVRSPSQNSTHEVIWEPGGGSPNSRNSTDDKDVERQRSSTSIELSHQPPLETGSITPHPHRSEAVQFLQLDSDKGAAFDPADAAASIREWSWRLSRAAMPTIATSSDSESNEVIPASEERPVVTPRIPIRSVASAPDVPKSSSKKKMRAIGRPTPDVEDVVFFPLLPSRKSTNDWHSPLPDIGLSPPKSPASQLLHDEGIDATGATSIDSPAPKLQLSAFLPLTDQQGSATPSVEFNPYFCLRRKSTIRAHPQSPARIGSQASMGSSIGVSSGERRQGSMIKHGIHRVQTIDNIHKGERAGTWARNRPPSLYPLPTAPSPAEISDNDSSRPISPLPAQREEPVDGKAIGTKSQLSRMDSVGIYEKITGTVRAALGLDDSKDGRAQEHNCVACGIDSRQPSVDWVG